MKHEKIIKRPDGTQYRIDVILYTDSWYSKAEWLTMFWTRAKGKKNWHALEMDIADYEYRSLSMPEREKYDMKNALRFVTTEEILEAKMELWEKIKPVI